MSKKSEKETPRLGHAPYTFEQEARSLEERYATNSWRH